MILQELNEEVLAKHDDVQSLLEMANDATKGKASDQAAVIKDPVNDITKRWNDLSQGCAQRLVSHLN